MADKQEPERIEEYLKDLKTIKSLLIKVEDTPLIEKWVFVAWGIFTLAGTVVHCLLRQLAHLPHKTIMLELWLPIILVGLILETIGWGRSLFRNSLTLSSPRIYRFIATFFSVAAGLLLLALVVIRLEGFDYMAIVLLTGFAILFFYIAMVGAYERMFIFAVLQLITGIVFFIVRPVFIVQVAATGGMIGLAMLLMGLSKGKKGAS